MRNTDAVEFERGNVPFMSSTMDAVSVQARRHSVGHPDGARSWSWRSFGWTRIRLIQGGDHVLHAHVRIPVPRQRPCNLALEFVL